MDNAIFNGEDLGIYEGLSFRDTNDGIGILVDYFDDAHIFSDSHYKILLCQNKSLRLASKNYLRQGLPWGPSG